MNYNKHLITEDHIKNEYIHEVDELFKLIDDKRDELKMKNKKIKLILKQYAKCVDKNKPILELEKMYNLEMNERNNIEHTVTKLINTVKTLMTKHNII
jgi:acetyl/propionyl-CoA carboxylase alpha subunit